MEIGRTQKLHTDQVGVLADEVGYVMVGLTPRASFVDALVRALGIDKDKATKIASDVNDKLLQKIREQLRALTENPKEGAQVVSGTVSAQGPKTRIENPLDRNSILAELETPTATPLSGRVVATVTETAETEKMESAPKPENEPEQAPPDENQVTEDKEPETKTSQEGADISIIAKKLSETTNTKTVTLDPYREPTH